MARIGDSELDVFPLSLGGNVFGWTADHEESLAILDAHAAGGGNFIDTSDSYMASVPGNSGGESETIIGEWFTTRGTRDATVIATKVSRHPQFPGLSGDNIRRAADASLGRLQTDRIDLYYAHFEDPNTPLEETAEAFDAVVREGKVRYTALSNFSPENIEAYIAICKANGYALPVALQPHYNLVHRNDFEDHLAPIAEREHLGVVPYYALASGFLTGKYRSKTEEHDRARAKAAAKYVTDQGLRIVDELERIGGEHGVSIATTALAWLLAKPTVVAPIASASRVEQVADLLAVATVELSADDVARLDAVSAWRPSGGDA
ncbi:aldo/keto reductase [Herbiconiux daphne]|uniref:Aldo/keto reductase n=1 Tax=Herbiconiux daphne TaxID=2970914 RepID=A0ABT2H3Z5_9MICO|nr:aldo/keto reductase [Herbiconiux daphne]MCS5734654.1 aldo/keto reductase [Herbiconiux daphne]